MKSERKNVKIKIRKCILESVPKNGICAEVGVWKGVFAEKILKQEPKKLYLIDPYVLIKGDIPRERECKTQRGMDDFFVDLKEYFSQYDNIEWVREYSWYAAELFPNEYFDWIYLDGDHHYEAVKKDLESFAPKIKSGGILCGDDWLWGPARDELEIKRPIKRAVTEFLDQSDSFVMEKVYISQFILRKK